MITDGFLYVAVLIFVTAVLVYLPIMTKGRRAEKIFRILPPVVMIYFVMMIMCTMRIWDVGQTAETYSKLKNPLLYAMLFLMLLRCDMRKILRLGKKMLIGFYAANVSIGLGFVIAYGIMHRLLGENSWKALGALCGSWMGGGGNMLAIQAALDVDETEIAYALVVDTICASVYIMFLLWAIGFSEKFNSWTRADTGIIDRIGRELSESAAGRSEQVKWQGLIMMTGISFAVSAASQLIGNALSENIPFLDSSTWTVLTVTFLGIMLAMTPISRISGAEELSDCLLYIVIALIASRADLGGIGNAPMWLITGFIVLSVHIAVMIIFARIFKIDIFTCAVASLANVGGTATAPVLAGAYSSALVPVGIIMALLGYIVGTGGGLITARIMEMLG